MLSFSGRHYPSFIILQCVRWYVSYALSYRNIEEMMKERGFKIDHATINRWVLEYAPLLEEKSRKYKKQVHSSWRMDETYIKVKGRWRYLYRAVDKYGKTVDFMLRARRDKSAALKFFRKAMLQNIKPKKVNIDKSGSNKAALDRLNKPSFLTGKIYMIVRQIGSVAKFNKVIKSLNQAKYGSISISLYYHFEYYKQKAHHFQSEPFIILSLRGGA